MLDQAHRLSLSWSHFSNECDRLKTVFSRLKYPKHLVNSTIKSFIDSKVCNQQQLFFSNLFFQYLTTKIPYDDFDGGPSTKVLLQLIESKYFKGVFECTEMLLTYSPL